MRTLITTLSMALVIGACGTGAGDPDTTLVETTVTEATNPLDLATTATPGSQTEDPSPGAIVELYPATVAAGEGAITLAIGLPAGYQVNETAPSSVTWSATGNVAMFPSGSAQSLSGIDLPLDIPVSFSVGTGVITATVNLFYCREDEEGLCLLDQVRFVQEITVGEGNRSRLSFPYEVTAPVS